jgi:hypothetical protein
MHPILSKGIILQQRQIENIRTFGLTDALMSTFSAYNSGTFTTGLKNGYASTVMSKAHRGAGN